MDFVASLASISTFDSSRRHLLSSYLVGFRISDHGPRRENLRSVVHGGKEVLIHASKPDEPDFGDREFSGRPGCGPDGLEGVCSLPLFIGYGTLSSVVYYFVPAVIWKQPDSGEAPPCFLLICSCTEHGEPGLDVHLWQFRHLIEDPILSCSLPLHVSSL